MDDLTALQKRSFELRKDIVELIRTGKAGHIGGDMSVLEILMTLYLRRMRITPQRCV